MNWIKENKSLIVRFAFLVPILLVAIVSISHVIYWYDLANPYSWAIYLSIAIEIAAMSAIAAASIRVKGFSVWFVFIIVTLIQLIGNIYFSYIEIDETSSAFLDWVELTYPIFELLDVERTDYISQKRWLAVLEGGLLPLISLTCLHFFIKYENSEKTEVDNKKKIAEITEDYFIERNKILEEKVEQNRLAEEHKEEHKEDQPNLVENNDDNIEPAKQNKLEKAINKNTEQLTQRRIIKPKRPKDISSKVKRINKK